MLVRNAPSAALCPGSGVSALSPPVLGLEPLLHLRLHSLSFSVGCVRDRLETVHVKLFKQCLEPKIRALRGFTEELFGHHCNYEN